MDQITRKTVAAYSANAALFEKRSSSASKVPSFLKQFAAQLDHGAHILDLGCGSGHDAAWYIQKGFRVTGIDPTAELISRAKKRCRNRRASFEVVSMQDAKFPAQKFDAVWANASLIHLPKKQLLPMLRKLKRWLSFSGSIGATIHNGKNEGFTSRTWIPGRFFSSYLKEELREHFLDAEFEIDFLKRVINQDRKGRWLNVIANKAKP